MIRVLPLSDMDLSTHTLTAIHRVMAFGVRQGSVGVETPLPYR